MQESGLHTWKWPEHDDIEPYPITDILQIIKPPSPFNNRGHYRVPEVDSYWGCID